MKVEFALKDLLRRYGMDKRGVVSDMAEYLGVKRQHASKIYNNHVVGLRFTVVSKISEWLLDKAPDEASRQELRGILPGALFRFAGPWDTLLRAPTLVCYVGERRQSTPPGARSYLAPHRWISGADSEVATEIVHGLSRDGATYKLDWKNVPFHLPDANSKNPLKHNKTDQNNAKRMFRKSQLLRDCVILIIGSQRVNFFLEPSVAEKFGCEPFVAMTCSSQVPIYMQYRENDPEHPISCFGGHKPPPGVSSPGKPGIYYRKEDEWDLLACSHQTTDAGVIILVHDQDRSVLEVILFGFSGLSTHALGRYFSDHPEFFWPLDETTDKRSVGIFVCEFKKAVENSDGDEAERPILDCIRTIRLTHPAAKKKTKKKKRKKRKA